MGVRVTESDDSIHVRPHNEQRAINIKTQVYPGFPTDLQQPMTALLCMANGTSTVCETIFEQRFNWTSCAAWARASSWWIVPC